MKCWHCDVELEEIERPKCWVKCCQKEYMGKECKEYLKKTVLAWDRAHKLQGRTING